MPRVFFSNIDLLIRIYYYFFIYNVDFKADLTFKLEICKEIFNMTKIFGAGIL